VDDYAQSSGPGKDAFALRDLEDLYALGYALMIYDIANDKRTFQHRNETFTTTSRIPTFKYKGMTVATLDNVIARQT